MSFCPKQWKLAIVNKYIKQQKDLLVYNIPKLVHFLIAKYFKLNETLKQSNNTPTQIDNQHSVIKSNFNFTEITGTIPFHTDAKNTYKWTFYVKDCKITKACTGISFGIQDESGSITMQYRASCQKRFICKNESEQSTEIYPYGQTFGKNDKISVLLKDNHLSFNKNNTNLGIAFDNIFQYKFITVQKFYCFISLRKGTEIHLVDFQII